MATQQSYQNYIPAPQTQNFSVPNIPYTAPVSSVQNEVQNGYYPSQTAQTYPNSGYVPRYAPMVYQGQVYSTPVANTLQQYPQAGNYAGQQQYQSQQTNGCPNKGGSVGTVNISINGVNPPGQQPMPQMPYCYPVPYYIPYPIQQNNSTQSIAAAQPVSAAQTPVASPEPLAASKVEGKQEEKTPKGPVVELTDDYIKNLEYDLNSDNKDTRKHAVAQLLKRFKEDDSRKDDVRLTALLNQALQDDSKPITFAAMQILQNGYANGNQTTVNRLDAIRKQNDKFGNAETADAILTLMSGKNPSLFTNNASPIRSNQ